MKKAFYLIIIFTAGCLSACKKNKGMDDGDGVNGPSKQGSTLDLIKDSVYLYADESYLWYNQLPTYKVFQPRLVSGADDITALTNEVNQLSQYAINPTTNNPYEYVDATGAAKYSFIDDGSVSDELNGTNGDFGFSVFYPEKNDLRIKYVYSGSPADSAGVKRGYQIIKINGRTDLDYDGDEGSNVEFVINAYAYSKTISMTLQRPDNTTFDVSLNVANYNVNPVLTYKVFNEGAGKKVGYIVFNTFTAVDNAGPRLLTAFNYFSQQNINELVVDLRYNGGGRIETAEYMDNLIVPPAASGTLMYTSYYNDKLQNNNYPLLKSQQGFPANFFSTANQQSKFAKNGSLNLSRVFFIVTGATASASELTINNLIPHIKVLLIGRTTYGKPVGFYGLYINKYQLYMPMFSTRNSADKGDYYSGMTPGSDDYPGEYDSDDVTKEFGDSTETLLKHALSYVKTGTYGVAAPAVQSLSKSTQAFSEREIDVMTLKLDEHKFKGMVANSPHVKAGSR